MKAYTDIEQSKKLADILPIESADMRYGYIAPYEFSDRMYEGGYDNIPYPKDFLKKNPNFSEDEYDGSLPCWSLAALLDYLSANFRVDIKYLDNYWELDCRVQIMYSKELVDACYEMFIKLNEQKRL